MKRTCLRRNTKPHENRKHGVPYDHEKTSYLRMKIMDLFCLAEF